jgi:hypothetical protein
MSIYVALTVEETFSFELETPLVPVLFVTITIAPTAYSSMLIRKTLRAGILLLKNAFGSFKNNLLTQLPVSLYVHSPSWCLTEGRSSFNFLNAELR